MEEYFTLIKIACIKNNIDSIKDYVKAGHINYEDKYYATILSIAALNNKYEICEYLIKNGANINNINSPPLVGAAQNGNYAICKLLLENGADVNMPETKNSSRTALQAACVYCNYEVVELLFDYGADHQIKNDSNETCLDCIQPRTRYFPEVIEFFDWINDEIITRTKYKIRKHLFFL